jgi:ABC-type cobalamin/Fe3+-siderophores transport system ATPase subunit
VNANRSGHVSPGGAARSVDVGGSSGQPLLVAERLTLGYRGRAVVREIDLCVERGDFWFLLGPNGAGKSTFARAVLGLLAPIAGKLRYEGGLRLGHSIGFVPQHVVLHPTLSTTLREFVSLGFGAQRVAGAEREKRVAWAIDAVGLGGRAASDVHDLSGGMRQRAMVARALVRQPELLVLDEPTSNLDPASQEALLVVLARLHRETRLTLLFVCHDVAVAARYASHVAFFHDGTVEAGGRELLMHPDVLRRVYGLDICVSLDEDGHATLHIESPEALA